MRIGLVLDRYDPRLGGAEQWTHQFVKHLLPKGHQLHIAACDFGPFDSHPRLRVHRLPKRRSRLACADAAAHVLRRLDLDVIHDMGVGWYCDVFQPHGGSRVASFEQNLLLIPAWRRPLKRIAARCLPRYREFEQLTARQYGSDAVVLALSRMVRSDMKRYHGVPDERIRLIYNGVDVERFSPPSSVGIRHSTRRQLGIRSEATALFLIVAHNFRLKGVPTLLRATAKLAAGGQQMHVAVVGGKLIAPYRRMAHRLGIADRVTFAGPVDDPLPYYSAADVYVQPTFYDPCSLVVLEALACGLPVITTRFNGAGELITGGQHGFLLDDPADHAVLADRMSSLLDPDLRWRQSVAARQLARQHTFTDNAERIEALYGEIVERKRRRAAERPFAA